MFTPPFCPNPLCRNHMQPRRPRWWRRYGFHPTKAFGAVPRFQCLDCGRSFSVQTFRLDYYAKRVIDYPDLLLRHSGSMSLRGSSRALHCSCATVQNRIDRLCRQALALHARLRPLASRDEAVCIDGFVDFDVSQYFPSETAISITRESLFFLDFSHATRRRSGRMSKEQKRNAPPLYARAELEKGAVSRSFRELLDSLELERPPRNDHPLVIITDDKGEYRSQLQRHRLSCNQDLEHKVVHRRVSSKAPRTYWNPLFASNYIEREIRKDQANHHRETVCFNRNVANGMSRLGLYLIGHNYVKKYRIKTPRRDDRVHAEAAGIPRDELRKGVAAMFEQRSFLSRIRLPPTLERVWRKSDPTPLSKRSPYLPRFALA